MVVVYDLPLSNEKNLIIKISEKFHEVPQGIYLFGGGGGGGGAENQEKYYFDYSP